MFMKVQAIQPSFDWFIEIKIIQENTMWIKRGERQQHRYTKPLKVNKANMWRKDKEK